MISTQLHHYVPGFDEIAGAGDADFASSGWKQESVIRVGRFAAVESNVLLGAIGQIAPNRLQHIKNHLADWLVHFSEQGQ